MEKLCQRDPRWSKVKLGASDLTMGAYGCTTTCLAMAEGITPDILAKNAANYTLSGLVLWTAVDRALKNLEFVWRQTSPTDAYVKAQVENPSLHVLLEVNDGAHWVLAIRKTLFGNDYVAYDPWDGKECNVKAKYHNITKVVTFHKVATVPAMIPDALRRFMGGFLIVPEQHGRLYYVDMDGKRTDLGNDAMAVQQTIAKLAKGVTTATLEQIPKA